MGKAGKTHLIVFALILAAAFCFRITQLGYAPFSGDGARELNVGRLIAEGQYFPSQGVVMSFAKAHTGPAYYYLLAIPNMIWKDPRCALAFMALYQILAAMLLFSLARNYAGDDAGLIAALLFLASPLATFDMNKIWGVNHMPLFVMLTLWSIDQAFFQRRPWRLLIAAAGIGILAQLNIIGVLFIPFIIIMALVFRTKIPTPIWALSLLVLILSAAPFVMHELFSGFENTKAMFAFGGDTGALEKAATQAKAGLWQILSLRYRILTGRATGLVYRGTGQGVILLVLAGQLLAALKLFQSIRNRKFETIADKQALLFLAWFFLPVIFLLLFPGKIRGRYFFIAFPIGTLFAGAAISAFFAKINKKVIRLAVYTVLGLVVIIQSGLTVHRSFHATDGNRISIKAKIAISDMILENLGNGKDLDANLYCCALPETDSRAVGLDYILQTRRKGKQRPAKKPGVYLVYPSTDRPPGAFHLAGFAATMQLIRFENMAALTAYLQSPHGKAHCPDFWNIHEQYKWETNRERPFDKILAYSEQGPPAY